MCGSHQKAQHYCTEQPPQFLNKKKSKTKTLRCFFWMRGWSSRSSTGVGSRPVSNFFFFFSFWLFIYDRHPPHHHIWWVTDSHCVVNIKKKILKLRGGGRSVLFFFLKPVPRESNQNEKQIKPKTKQTVKKQNLGLLLVCVAKKTKKIKTTQERDTVRITNHLSTQKKTNRTREKGYPHTQTQQFSIQIPLFFHLFGYEGERHFFFIFEHTPPKRTKRRRTAFFFFFFLRTNKTPQPDGPKKKVRKSDLWRGNPENSDHFFSKSHFFRWMFFSFVIVRRRGPGGINGVQSSLVSNNVLIRWRTR